MLESIIGEILNQALQQAAQDTGLELGRELRNFLKVSRGETAWEDLTYVQQTMFLGGDRQAYERIRQRIRKVVTNSARSQNKPKCRDRSESIPPGPFYDYSSF